MKLATLFTLVMMAAETCFAGGRPRTVDTGGSAITSASAPAQVQSAGTGHYVGGVNGTRKGSHYVNPNTSNHYRDNQGGSSPAVTAPVYHPAVDNAPTPIITTTPVINPAVTPTQPKQIKEPSDLTTTPEEIQRNTAKEKAQEEKRKAGLAKAVREAQADSGPDIIITEKPTPK